MKEQIFNKKFIKLEEISNILIEGIFTSVNDTYILNFGGPGSLFNLSKTCGINTSLFTKAENLKTYDDFIFPNLENFGVKGKVRLNQIMSIFNISTNKIFNSISTLRTLKIKLDNPPVKIEDIEEEKYDIYDSYKILYFTLSFMLLRKYIVNIVEPKWNTPSSDYFVDIKLKFKSQIRSVRLFDPLNIDDALTEQKVKLETLRGGYDPQYDEDEVDNFINEENNHLLHVPTLSFNGKIAVSSRNYISKNNGLIKGKLRSPQMQGPYTKEELLKAENRYIFSFFGFKRDLFSVEEMNFFNIGVR